MAYKVRLGAAEMSGTLGTGDIHYTEDTDVKIDFDSNKIKFKTNDVNRLQVSNDRVQVQKQLVVGSTSAGNWSLSPPSEDALHVQDGTAIFQKNSADAFPPTVAFNKSRNATDGSNTIVQANDCLGYIHFMGNDGSGYEESACIAAYIDGTPGNDDTPGRLEFGTTPDGDNEVVERMRIDSAGRVGIGTTSPGTNLHVKGNDVRVRLDGHANSHPGLELSENGTRKWIVFNDYTNDNLTFKTDSNVRMSIEQAGNVGINTTSPKATLSVAGSLAINVTSINSSNDPGTTYSVATTDCVILVNTRPTAQGGIDSTMTITLPDAASFPGRVITIKDAAGYCDVNAISVTRAGSDTINGVDATVDLPTPASFKTLISDGVNSWQEIGS